jgi:hypothetical protein
MCNADPLLTTPTPSPSPQKGPTKGEGAHRVCRYFVRHNTERAVECIPSHNAPAFADRRE